MAKPKIVFLQSRDTTERIFHEGHFEQLREVGEVTLNESNEPPTEELTAKLIEGADIAITSWGCPKLNEQILQHAPHLKAVFHCAGTVKAVVTPDLWKRGISVSGASTSLGQGVAETALGMTIASLKNMWRLTQNTKQGGWRMDSSATRELYEIKIGVIGAGQAGSHYIKLLQNFDVDVLLYDPVCSEERAESMGAKKVELEQLVREVDLISIHAPSIPETYHLINKERLQQMKDDTIIINTARGDIIDQQALVDELSKGRLFACLDVTTPEPPAEDDPLRTLPNAVLTPHIAGAINNGLHRMGQFTVDDIKLFLEGKDMRGEVREEQLNVLA